MGDWDRMPPNLKKAFTWKEVASIHAACGGFLAIMECFSKEVPQADFAAAQPEIANQFKLSVLDHDILSYMEAGVPPISLKDVRFVRTVK